MSEKYILLSMEDEKLKKVSEILSNKTCKKILDFMADEKSVSETDISKKLEIPLNTVEYNLKKLVGVQLVEKTSEFFWSKKGKKITIYQISNKSIIIFSGFESGKVKIFSSYSINFWSFCLFDKSVF
jgi:predicted transcriptional regulator